MRRDELERQIEQLQKINKRHHRTILEAHQVLSKYGAPKGGDLPARLAEFAAAAYRERDVDRPAGS